MQIESGPGGQGSLGDCPNDITATEGSNLLSDTVIPQTDVDVTTRQCVVSGRNLSTRYTLFRHKALPDDDVKLCLLS